MFLINKTPATGASNVTSIIASAAKIMIKTKGIHTGDEKSSAITINAVSSVILKSPCFVGRVRPVPVKQGKHIILIEQLTWHYPMISCQLQLSAAA